MILQIRDKIIEFDQKDKNLVFARIQPEGETLDDASLLFVRESLMEHGVHIEIHELKPFKSEEKTRLDWFRQDKTIIQHIKEFRKSGRK